MKFFEAFANMFRVPDLRKRLLFTLGLLAVYRLGSQIPTPGINLQRGRSSSASQQGSIFGFFDLFAGGNIRRLTVFALGIMPYITASIILQLMTVVVPTLEKLQKEGELGRRKITQWTRYLTIILSVLQSFGIAQGLMSMQQGIVINPGLRVRHADDSLADHRLGVHHVAGRADQRARRRQRHVADHLHRHRGGAAARHREHLPATSSSPTNGARSR